MVLGLPYLHGQNLMHIPAHHRYPLILCVISATLSACSGGVPSDSGCRNLVYKESGLSRADYLPCASEIVIALDHVMGSHDDAVRIVDDAGSRHAVAAFHAHDGAAGPLYQVGEGVG